MNRWIYLSLAVWILPIQIDCQNDTCPIQPPYLNRLQRRHCSEVNGTLYSQGYPRFQDIPVQSWTIQVADDHYIKLDVLDIDLGDSDGNCQYNYVQILSKNSLGALYNFATLCSGNGTYLSDVNYFYIFLIVSHVRTDTRGFRAEYQSHSFPFLTDFGQIQDEILASSENDTDCAEGWIPFKYSCYYVGSVERSSWLEAEDECLKRNGHLVSVNDAEEMDFVHGLVIERLGKSPYTYIGLSDRDREGRFRWADGSPLALAEFYQDRLEAQPDGNAFEDCVMIKFMYLYRRDQWHDTTCAHTDYQTVNYVCETRRDDVQLSAIEVTPVEQACGAGLFECRDGSCIPQSYVCDNKSDCSTSEDESSCPPTLYQCPDDSCADSWLRFECDNGEELLWSYVCDFYPDCQHGEDEEGCYHRDCTDGEFRCDSGQCVPKKAACSGRSECYDESDESESLCLGVSQRRCYDGTTFSKERFCDGWVDCPGPIGEDERYCPPPLTDVPFCTTLQPNTTLLRCLCQNHHLINTTHLCLRQTDTDGYLLGCRDASHLRNCQDYECPEGFVKCHESYCIPVQFACDGEAHCPNKEDEIDCEERSCPGMLLCTASKVCLPLELHCNGVADCQYSEDELFCFSCPRGCSCSALEFSCSTSGIQDLDFMTRDVRGLDLSKNRVGVDVDFDRFQMLFRLNLSSSEISLLASNRFQHLKNLRVLDLSDNGITSLENGTFLGLSNVQDLRLKGNAIRETSAGAFRGLDSLRTLDLSGMNLEILRKQTFIGLDSLENLNLSFNRLTFIHRYVFKDVSVLKILDLSGNEMDDFDGQLFSSNKMLLELKADHYSFCCVAEQVPHGSCFPEKEAISSCDDLIADHLLFVILWIQGLLALSCNSFVLVYRCQRHLKSSQNVLLINLCVSDLLMGIYLVAIASVDVNFRGIFVENSRSWRQSWLCSLCGILATVSSEVSVLVLTIVSVSRCISIISPFSQPLKFSSAVIMMALGWTFVVFLAVIPVMKIDYFGEDYYSKSTVCLPLHLTSKRTMGWEYSVFIFLGLNSLSFVTIVVSYSLMYHSTRRVFRRSGRRRSGKSVGDDVTFPVKLAVIVGTDMVCWLPVIVIQGAALGGCQIPGDVYAWVAVLVLPVNAALNPLIYTISTIGARRRRLKRERYGSSSGSVRSGQIMVRSPAGLLTPKRSVNAVTESTIVPAGIVIEERDFLRPNFIPYDLDTVLPRGGRLVRLDDYRILTLSEVVTVCQGIMLALCSLHDDDLLHYRLDRQHVYIYIDQDGQMTPYLQKGVHKQQPGTAYKGIDIQQFGKLIQLLLDDLGLSDEEHSEHLSVELGLSNSVNSTDSRERLDESQETVKDASGQNGLVLEETTVVRLHTVLDDSG